MSEASLRESLASKVALASIASKQHHSCCIPRKQDTWEWMSREVQAVERRLRSYAGSASLFSYSSGHTLLERLPSSPRAAGQQALHAAQAPLVASHQALQSAVALCQRHSFEASQHTAQQLWFEVLQVLLA